MKLVFVRVQSDTLQSRKDCSRGFLTDSCDSILRLRALSSTCKRTSREWLTSDKSPHCRTMKSLAGSARRRFITLDAQSGTLHCARFTGDPKVRPLVAELIDFRLAISTRAFCGYPNDSLMHPTKSRLETEFGGFSILHPRRSLRTCIDPLEAWGHSEEVFLN
jgi:hypothetical protein